MKYCSIFFKPYKYTISQIWLKEAHLSWMVPEYKEINSFKLFFTLYHI